MRFENMTKDTPIIGFAIFTLAAGFGIYLFTDALNRAGMLDFPYVWWHWFLFGSIGFVFIGGLNILTEIIMNEKPASKGSKSK